MLFFFVVYLPELATDPNKKICSINPCYKELYKLFSNIIILASLLELAAWNL